MLNGGPYTTPSQVRQCHVVVSAAAVSEADDVADEDLIRAERVAVCASRRRVRDPFPGRGLHEVAEYPIKPRPHANHPRSGLALGAVHHKEGGRDHLNGRD